MKKKKKIGIITILKVNNYGAELQAFALQEKLNRMGFDAEIIDYLFYKNKSFRYTKQAKPFINLGLKRRFKEALNPSLTRIKTFSCRKELREREQKFKAFHKKFTRLSSETYCSIDELYKGNFDYDVFIVGSDQVWNPYSNVNIEPYFLTFAPENAHKISYASSFGVSSIPKQGCGIYKDCIGRLDYIMVREQQGVDIVKNVSGRDAKHVLDPTLLLDQKEWESIATFPEYKEPYVLLYELSDSFYITQLAKEIRTELGSNIVRVCKNVLRQEKDPTIVNVTQAGPSEFIGLFLNASFVLTNSFHGTIFSVNFKKSFYTILSKKKSNNSRQENFLATVGLTDRIIYDDEEFPQQEKYYMDFEKPTLLLKEKQKESVSLLLNALNGHCS